MAELKSTTYTAQELAAGNAGKLIDSAELISGKVQFLQCDWTVPAATGAADTVLLGFLPSGMSVVGDLSTITLVEDGGAATLNIGTSAGTATNIATAISVATAGTYLFGGVGSSASKPPVFSIEKQAIYATLSAGMTEAVAVRFNFVLVNSN